MSVASSLTIQQRIASRSARDGECVLWQGGTMKNGYGSISWQGKRWLVHRAMWTSTCGPIADDLTIDHLCRRRNCVNVNHMELTTRAENSRRGGGLEVAREARRTRTHCEQGHEYTPENTRVYRGERHCRICSRGYTKAHRKRSGAERPRVLQPCGTDAAYSRHRKAGERCQECSAAHAATARARRAASRPVEDVDLPEATA